MRISDWISDVCSSDLVRRAAAVGEAMADQRVEDFGSGLPFVQAGFRLDDPVREPQARVIADEREEARIGRGVGKHKSAVERQRAIGEAPFHGDLVHIERHRADLSARAATEIGRASWRDSGCRYVSIQVCAGYL